MNHIDPHQFTGRLPPGSPARYRENIETVFKLAANFHAKVADVQANPALSDVGKSDAIKRLWAGDASAHFAQIKTGVIKEAADIKQQRAALYPKAPDRADLFGEMQRAEARTWLRGLDDTTRRRALETDSDTIRDAIMFAPAEMSGVSAELKQRVVDGIVERQFGHKLGELDALEEGVGNVLAAVRVTEGVLAKLPGLSGVSETCLRMAGWLCVEVAAQHGSSPAGW
jgi:hypothetical protein